MTKISWACGRRLISALAVVAFCAIAPTVANAQAIGRATSVKPQAEANARTLSAGSEVAGDHSYGRSEQVGHCCGARGNAWLILICHRRAG